ncbi:P52 family lipoprotein, partial [Borreliella garinii]|uniref:P52 family lipoprotein n=1 Tax=Borreliella garinii TaxID=29519 RepID=UPI003528E85D
MKSILIEFFLDLGSERSKEPIKLFGRKNDRNDRFKHEVHWLYSCINAKNENYLT